MDAPEITKPARDSRVPEPYSTVCPWVISRDTGKLIEFATTAFGAKEIARVINEDGSIGHAEFFIGESVMLAFDARPHWPDTPAYLRIYVPDADETFESAIRAGGESVTTVAKMPWGDRVGRIRDPLGNLWWIMARIEEVDAAELERRWSLPEYVEAMTHVTAFEPFPPKPG
jgi:PhnB protein